MNTVFTLDCCPHSLATSRLLHNGHLTASADSASRFGYTAARGSETSVGGGGCYATTIPVQASTDRFSQELSHLTNSFTQLRQAQAKFRACIENVTEVKPQNKGMFLRKAHVSKR